VRLVANDFGARIIVVEIRHVSFIANLGFVLDAITTYRLAGLAIFIIGFFAAAIAVK
jgi:hypothetical protein